LEGGGGTVRLHLAERFAAEFKLPLMNLGRRRTGGWCDSSYLSWATIRRRWSPARKVFVARRPACDRRPALDQGPGSGQRLR